MPIISQFHNDNQIKNTSFPISNGFNVGDGLLINEQEYFVLAKSITNENVGLSTSDIIANEYKLYNNNTNEYCWLKFFDDKYFVFTETEDISTNKKISEGSINRKAENINDWETINNYSCNYKLYHSLLTNDCYLQQNWNIVHKFYKGFLVDDNKISVLKYDYEYFKPWEYSKENKNSIWLYVMIFFTIILITEFLCLEFEFQSSLFIYLFIAIGLFIFLNIKASIRNETILKLYYKILSLLK